ncbi:unannotated protein [freshwater metagenome]|uniref:Unannotated protein n=1 Tax=freshwater metagenome TaxID=449393 RepID=A0A6J6YN89_9ZZZZ
MDLVNEEDVTVLQFGEYRCEVSGTLERRPGGDVQVDAHLGGDNGGETGFA